MKNPRPKSAAARELESWIDGLQKSGKKLVVELREFVRLDVDVRTIREGLGMSRQEFASTFGLSFRTVENWEDARREPEGPAKAYLVAIAFAPRAVAQAIKDYHDGKLPGEDSVRSRGTPPGRKKPGKKMAATRVPAARPRAAVKHA